LVGKNGYVVFPKVFQHFFLIARNGVRGNTFEVLDDSIFQTVKPNTFTRKSFEDTGFHQLAVWALTNNRQQISNKLRSFSALPKFRCNHGNRVSCRSTPSSVRAMSFIFS